MKRLPLSRGKEALVDDVDYPFVSRWKWSFSTKGYAHRKVARAGKQATVWLHRLIAERAGISLAGHIDHIDRNKLNCQRANLRAATNSQNLANRGKNRNNTSGYKGVTWDKERRKWLAQVQVHGRNKYLGRYDDKQDAHAAYRAAMDAHFAEYAYAGEPEMMK
jgi:hypothetical protein